MAAKTWGGGTGPVDGLWSTATNWTGDVKPQAGDDVVFDATDVTNCDIDENTANLGSLTATAAYTGTIDGATSDSDVTVAGDVTLDCTRVELGDGTWACNGHWDSEDVGTFVAGDSTIKMTGTAKNLNVDGGDINDVTVDGGSITWTNAAIISGTLTIINTASLTISAALNMWGAVIVSATGINTITGGSNLHMTSGSSIATKGGVIDVATLIFSGNHDANVVAGTYESASVIIRGIAGATRTFKFAAGVFNFSGNVVFDVTGAGNYIVDAATNNPTINITGNCTMQKTGAGALIYNGGSGAVSVDGNISITGTVTYNAGSGTITLAGAGEGTQTVDSGGKTLEAIVINDAGAEKQLTNNTLRCASFNIINGDLDPNGQNITTTNNFTIGTGGQISVPASLNGSTWTVGGNLLLTGEVGDLVDLVGTAAWFVAVTGTAVVYYCDIAFCDASGGSTIGACLCTNVDSGNNVNVTFAPVIAFFTATPASIVRGNSSTLAWSADSCGAIISTVIDQGIGAVANIGSVAVSPTVTTTYTLTVTCPTGVATASVTVTVTEPVVVPTGVNQADFMRKVLGRYRRPRR